MTTLKTRGALGALTGALCTALLAAPSLATSTPAPDSPEAPRADGQLLLVLDASGSMRDADGAGEPKIEAARSALETVVSGLGDEQRVGLRMFASTESESDTAAACSDSELVVPVDSGNRSAIGTAIQDYEPFGGETPIGFALQEAAKDLGSEGQRSILLVSDGLSTCDPDPCEVAQDLTEDGIDLAIHVVGFNVDSQAREQLRCVAEAGNGSYIDATDADSLTDALTQVSTRAFRPFTIAGEPVVGTPAPQGAPALGAGQFTDTLAEDNGESKHYLIDRSLPGSTLHVGVTMRPDSGGSDAYLLHLETPDGRLCNTDSGSPFALGGGNSFGTAVVASAAPADTGPCSETDQLVLRIEPNSGSDVILGQPLEIVVTEEPPIGNADQLPSTVAEPPTWQGPTVGDPVADVVAGSSLNDAPLLEPGRTHSSELTRGEIVFFRVPVEHGQHLEALVDFPAPTGALQESTGTNSDIADLTIVGPNRGEADSSLADMDGLTNRAILSPDAAVQAGATTFEVRHANVRGGNEIGSSLAGDYYIGVSLTSTSDLLLPVPFTLTTDVLGEVGGVPEYLTGEEVGDPAEGEQGTEQPTGTATTTDQEQTTRPTDATTPDDAAEAAPPSDAPDDGAGRGLLIGLGALGVALLGAGVAVLTRVLRS